MTDYRTILERDLERVARPASFTFEDVSRRRDRKRRNQRIAAGVVGVAVFVAAIWIVTSGGVFDRTRTPVPGPAETGPAAPASVATVTFDGSTCSMEITADRIDPGFVLFEVVNATEQLVSFDSWQLLEGSTFGAFEAAIEGDRRLAGPLGDSGTLPSGGEVRHMSRDLIPANYSGLTLLRMSSGRHAIVCLQLREGRLHPVGIIGPIVVGTEPTGTGPAETGPTAAGADPRTDFLLDLDTGKTTQLPESIVGTGDWTAGYAVSPDGSELAYYGHAEDGSVQVFVGDLDGTNVRQITDNAAARLIYSTPGWSPDGTKIAYVGHLSGDAKGRGFVIDLASGVTTQVTSDTEQVGGIQFSPDGSSILYTTWIPLTRRGPASELPFVDHRVRIVPLTGGEASTLVSGDRTWDGWGGPTEARLSPDGSLLSYLCGNSSDDVLDLCVANADGSGARVLASGEIMSASWSPDGTRIAYWVFHAVDVLVVDVATGVSSYVTEGAHPVWLDNHTLIVEHDRCSGPGGSNDCGG